MAKTLAIFFDGTWNKREELTQSTLWERTWTAAVGFLTGEPAPDPATTPVTNVLKLMRAVLPSTTSAGHPTCGFCKRPVLPGTQEQVAFYLAGVGTAPYWVAHVLEGATGYGIDRNIQDAYQFITQNYVPGDALYLFGFSRGAFTARSLAGFLDIFGFIAPSEMQRLPQIYVEYEKAVGLAGVEGARRYAKEHVRKPEKGWRSDATIKIWFLGVWDTVGALLRSNSQLVNFHQTELPSNVERAYQALALHEVRPDFVPVLWTHKPHAWQHVEQVWFPGTHSDVGGGYAPEESGPSDRALKWMACRAMEAGLALDIEYLRELNPPGRVTTLHDSHGGALVKWSYPAERRILQNQVPTGLWSTIGLHQSAIGAVAPRPFGNGEGERLLRIALDTAERNASLLEKQLDSGGPGIVRDQCQW